MSDTTNRSKLDIYIDAIPVWLPESSVLSSGYMIKTSRDQCSVLALFDNPMMSDIDGREKVLEKALQYCMPIYYAIPCDITVYSSAHMDFYGNISFSSEDIEAYRESLVKISDHVSDNGRAYTGVCYDKYIDDILCNNGTFRIKCNYVDFISEASNHLSKADVSRFNYHADPNHHNKDAIATYDIHFRDDNDVPICEYYLQYLRNFLKSHGKMLLEKSKK